MKVPGFFDWMKSIMGGILYLQAFIQRPIDDVQSTMNIRSSEFSQSGYGFIGWILYISWWISISFSSSSGKSSFLWFFYWTSSSLVSSRSTSYNYSCFLGFLIRSSLLTSLVFCFLDSSVISLSAALIFSLYTFWGGFYSWTSYLMWEKWHFLPNLHPSLVLKC